MMRDRDEQVGLAKMRTCTKCRKSGHNRSTCKAVPAKVAAEGMVSPPPYSRNMIIQLLDKFEFFEKMVAAEGRREIGARESRGRGFQYTSEEINGGYIDDSTSEEMDDSYIEDSTSEEIDDAYLDDSTSEEVDDAYVDDSTSEEIDVAYIDDNTSEESSKHEQFEVCNWTVRGRRSTRIELKKARMKQSPALASRLSHRSDLADQLIYWNKFKSLRFIADLPKNPHLQLKEQHRELSVEGPQVLASRAAKTQPIASVRAIVEAEMSADEEVYVEPKPKYRKRSVSSRGDVSEGKKSSPKKISLKERVVAAYKESKKTHFVVTMCETHVSRRFCWTIPKSYAKKYLFSESEEINLTVDGKTWNFNYKLYKNKTCVVIEGSRWADFVTKNNLELGDVCAFEPSKQVQHRTAELKVTIFRVVEVFTPLMLWKRINGGRNGKKAT